MEKEAWQRGKKPREKVSFWGDRRPSSAPGTPHLGQCGVDHQLHIWRPPNRGWESTGAGKWYSRGI